MGERSEEHINALLEWVGAVAGLDASSLAELRDGRVLGEALAAVAPSLPRIESVLGIVRCIASQLCAQNAFQKLENDLAGTVADEVLADALGLLLAFAVQGERKEHCVKQIMDFDPTLQQHIMVEVETMLGVVASARKDEAPPQSPFVDSPATSATPGSAPNRSKMQRENFLLREENEGLLGELTQAQKCLEKVESELTELKRDMKENVLKKEVALEETFRVKLSEVEADLEQRLENERRLQTQLAEAEKQASLVPSLKDQLEILNAQVQEAAKKDASLLKLRLKVDSMGDMRKRLTALENSNADLLSRNTDAEQKLKHLEKLKSELEACKMALTQEQLKNGEQKTLSKEQAESYRLLKEEYDELLRRETDAMFENRQFRLDLQLGQNDVCTEEEQALGISELNPQVRAELEQLRRENQEMHEQLSVHSKENLSRLEMECDSSKRLSETLQSQLRDSRAECVSLRADLKTANVLIEHTKSELCSVTQEANRADVANLVNEMFLEAFALGDLNSKNLEISKLGSLLEDYKKSHSASNDQLDALNEKLREAEKKLVIQRDTRLRAEASAERLRIQVNDLNSKNSQLRRQLKSFQLGRGKSSVENEDDRELLAQILELQTENQELNNEIDELRKLKRDSRTISHTVGKGVNEMIRGFEEKITKLEKENKMIRMEARNELTSRKSVEKELNKLQSLLEELKAENISLRLKAERSRAPLQPKNTNVAERVTSKPQLQSKESLDDNRKECKQQ